ncbi:MAG: endonuclease/exonuclease/phosphatase family protein [Bacteroidaceae bacterium]|nr:endonuclease/exonuclease/phosphatase family protein [Bacteroidaceae bacterium]
MDHSIKKTGTKFLLSAVLSLHVFLACTVSVAAQTTDKLPRQLRLMTYNLHHCEGTDDVLDIPRIAYTIESLAADVVAVQELDSMTQRTHRVDQLRELGRQSLLHPTYAGAIDYQGGRYGIGILSKEHPRSVRRIPLPGKEPRVLLVCEFKDYVFANTHLALQESNRLASLPLILQEAQRTDKPFFIAGDWNAQPESKFMQEMQKDFQLLNNTKVFTYPASQPKVRIDYIAVYKGRKKGLPNRVGLDGNALSPYRPYVNEAAVVLRESVWPVKTYSDHRPVTVDVVLPTAAHRLLDGKPYLQNPLPTEMTVMFQTRSVCHCWVEYGPDRQHLQKARTLVDGQEVCYDLENKIVLGNLQPGRQYVYRVCAVELLKKGSYENHFGDTLRTEFYRFSTPADKDFTALIFNDLHTVQASYEALLKATGGLRPDFAIFNGDCLPEPKDRAHAIHMIHQLSDPLNGSEIPIIFMRGNHEIRNFYSAGMHSLIGYPGGKTYGAFNWGDTRFVMLDCGEDKEDSTYVYAGLNDFTQLRMDQLEYLKTELKSKDFRSAKHRVLLTHIPIFGSGMKYNPCADLWRALLQKAKFDIAFGAHIHQFKFFPHGVDGCTYPVQIGGGPNIKKCTVSILSKKGGKLHLKVLNAEGESLAEQDL